METRKIKLEPKEFWDDTKWGEEHYPELQKRYPDKWVAIVNKTVAGVGKNISAAERMAHEKTKREIRNIPVMFVESGTHIY